MVPAQRGTAQSKHRLSKEQKKKRRRCWVWHLGTRVGRDLSDGVPARDGDQTAAAAAAAASPCRLN